jgi:hypothetical protein
MSRLLKVSFLMAILSTPLAIAPARATAPTDYDRVMNAANNDPDTNPTEDAVKPPATLRADGYNPKNISIYGQPQFHQSPGTSLLAPALNQSYGSRTYNTYATTTEPAATPVASNGLGQ